MDISIRDFRNFREDLVIYYGVEGHEINAKTLANSIIALTDTIKLIDSIINPGYEIELVVEGIGIGSFRIDIKKKFEKGVSNIFSKDNFKNIALGIISTIIWELIHPEKEIKIVNNTNEYILEKGNERIILPKEASIYLDSVKRNDSIREELGNTFQIIKNDPKIEYVKFSSSQTSTNANLVVNRPSFDMMIQRNEDEETKEETISTRVTIIRAVLEKGNRRWQFLWNGIKISAPIRHEQFFIDFIAHKIRIAPGDALEIELKIIRKLDPETGLFVNSDYEVVKVLGHLPGFEQSALEM